MQAPLIIGHGGSAARAYRDVLEALRTALDTGADGFEFDVRRTGDGVLVVHHDAGIGDLRLGAVSYETAAEAARALGYRLARLSDILRATGGRLHLDVELKEAGYEDAVARALTDAGIAREAVMITSFLQPALDAVHAVEPSMRTGLLVADVSGDAALELFDRSGAACLCPEHSILGHATLESARRDRVPLLPWTVNDPTAMRRLLAAPALIGLITDAPALAIAARDGR